MLSHFVERLLPQLFAPCVSSSPPLLTSLGATKTQIEESRRGITQERMQPKSSLKLTRSKISLFYPKRTSDF